MLVIALSILLPIIGFLVGPTLEEQFFPIAERDHFHFSVRLPAQASLQETERVAGRAREIVMQYPEVRRRNICWQERPKTPLQHDRCGGQSIELRARDWCS